MKQKEITGIVETLFKTINKLLPKILKEFNADDIHEFRIVVKKLRAFLRLVKANDKEGKATLPKQLKTFYGYIGIIRNVQLQKHAIFKYVTEYKIEQPKTYIQILDEEKSYWEKQAADLMTDNSFKDNEHGILKKLPAKLEKPTTKRFLKTRLTGLKAQLKNMKEDNPIHTVRKILKDILYNLHYLVPEHLPKPVSKEEDLKLLTKQLGDFRDKCIQLELLSDEYLDKVADANEKQLLLQMKKKFLHEKHSMMEQLASVCTNMFEKI